MKLHPQTPPILTQTTNIKLK